MEPDTVDPQSYEGKIQEKITSFISTLRSENTRTLARQIVEFLLEKRGEQWKGMEDKSEWFGGWIRSSEIFNEMKDKDPNPYTITRLLRDLAAAGIIDRYECPKRIKGHAGKKPVFYRVPSFFDFRLFNSRKELIYTIEKQSKIIDDLNTFFLAAQLVFTDHPEIKSLINAQKKKIEDGKYPKNTVIVDSDLIKESDPCKSL